MANQRVLVLGGNFAGLTAALTVKHDLGDDVDVTVVSKSDQFQFNPSLIWIPFGKRPAGHVTFPVARRLPGRPHAAPAQARRDDPRPTVARGQARLREVLPVEDAQRLREAALIRPRHPRRHPAVGPSAASGRTMTSGQ